MAAQTDDHDHAMIYALLTGGVLLILGIIVVWFYAF